MGPLWSLPIEWWYYGGWAHDQTIRYQRIPNSTAGGGAILYGIGTNLAGSNQAQFESHSGP